MKLTSYDKNNFERKFYKKTNNMAIIEEFVNSEYDCVKVEGWTTQSADGCTTSLNNTIKRMNIGGIRAFTKRGEVFLIKLNGDE